MTRKKMALWTAAAILLLGLGSVALAQSSSGFQLNWHLVGSGGGSATSAEYQVNGSIGQALAGPPQASSASYRVESGYWVGTSAEGKVLVPVVFKN